MSPVRPEIAALDGYTAPPQSARVKLNQNESPFDLPGALKQKISRKIAELDWHRYPDAASRRLRERIARATGWKPEGVIVGNGSNELIQWTVTAAVETGASVVIAAPTFSLYRSQVVFRGAQPVEVSCAGPGPFDTTALLGAVEEHSPAAVFVCSPNNPTGRTLPASSLEKLCRATDGLVIADEAYHHFSDQDYRPLLERHDNLVLLRTFSKAFGLAALRIGYLLAAPELVREVDKVRLPYNLNVASALAAEELLDDQKTVSERVDVIVGERARLVRELKSVKGLTVTPTEANFILCELARVAPASLVGELLNRDILIRDVSSYRGLEQCVRVTVGIQTENDELLRALPKALKRAGGAHE